MFMPTYELARAEWRRYCDRLSRELAGRRVELDVASLGLGDHVEARWLPLLGIVFDARGDVLEIALDGVGHSIVGPREIHFEETERGLVSLAIVSANETVETLRFREPLRLPPPDASQLERRERRRRPGDER
jgi:hypothetical protein